MHRRMITGLLALLPLSQSLAVTDNDLRLCSTISDSSQRLACYDQLVKKLPVYSPNAEAKALPEIAATTAKASKEVVSQAAAQPVPQAEPEIAPVKNEVTAVEVTDQFGMEHKVSKQEEEVQALTMTISKATKNAHGYWFITFENGQKWKTVTSDRNKLKAGQEVEIERGFLNSFNASVVGSNRSFKIKRLK